MGITLVQSPAQVGGAPPTGPVFSDACASGYVIVVGANITGGSYPNITGITATDNVNTGSYTLVATYQDSVNSFSYGWLAMVCNAAGTPTVTIGNNGAYVTANGSMFSGFTGTPTLDASATLNLTAQTSETPSWNVVSYQANELLLAQIYASSYTTDDPTGWTVFNASGLPMAWWGVHATTGTLVFNPTLGTSVAASGLAIGIYGKAAAAGGSNMLLLGV